MLELIHLTKKIMFFNGVYSVAVTRLIVIQLSPVRTRLDTPDLKVANMLLLIEGSAEKRRPYKILG